MDGDLITGFRQALQDFVTPDLKAMNVEIVHVKEEVAGLNQRVDKFEAVLVRFLEDMSATKANIETVFREIVEIKHEIEKSNARSEAILKEMAEMKRDIAEVKVSVASIHSKLDVDKRVREIEIQLASGHRPRPSHGPAPLRRRVAARR